jgi:hypothetical protein
MSVLRMRAGHQGWAQPASEEWAPGQDSVQAPGGRCVKRNRCTPWGRLGQMVRALGGGQPISRQVVLTATNMPTAM